MLLKQVVEEDVGAQDKSQSLTPMSGNVNARVRNTWEYKVSIPDSEEENTRRRWERKDTGEYFGNIGGVLTMTPLPHIMIPVKNFFVLIQTSAR